MNAVIAIALQQRVLMVLLLLLTFGVGIAAFLKLNIEAYPDPVPPLVDVITQSSGQSAEEIERYITIPIEVQMAGIPHLAAIRTISLFGLSDVKLQFTYDFTYDEAQQWVINRLSQLSPLLNGATPQISPSSPIGEIYRYRLVGPPGYSVLDLKTLEDWVLQRRFKAVPGVIDVNSWGGKTKIYEIGIDLDRLIAYGLTLPQVMQVLNNSNINVGGQTVNFGSQAAIVRGVGLIRNMDQIRDTMIATTNGVAVRIGDIARVSVGHQPRLGIAGQDDDDDIVEGIVLMRRGEQSMPTIRRVEAEVDKINAANILPPGVRIKRIYDRSELINVTTSTVLHNMVFGIVLIFLVQWLFLGDLRSALIVAMTIPFALFFAIILLILRGESANLLSVGAIDFGLVVDATVIMVENIFRRLSQDPDRRFTRSVTLHRSSAIAPFRGRFATIFYSAVEVNRAIFFSAAIIIAGFVPLFTMSGVEGHIFGPMAKTYAYAIVGGLIATFTASPALSAILLPERVKETETVVVRLLHRCYRPLLRAAIRLRYLTLAAAAVLLVIASVALPHLGLEFLPKLEEGNFWIRATLPPSISLEEANDYVNRMRKLIKSYPEVVTVVSQNGRPDDGTDATGFFNAEFYAPLVASNTWPAGVDKERLTEDMSSRLQAEFPGVEFNFSQNIEDNVEEAASGVKGENSVKLFGNDLTVLTQTAAKIKETMSKVPGVADLAVLNSLGQPTVQIEINRMLAARYGLQPGDINSTIAAAIGGQAAGNLYEDGSDRSFPMVVRLAPKYRQSLDAIRHITIGAPNPGGNGVVPILLTDVAEVKLVSGASFIYREGQQRYIPIKFSVRGRDLGGAVLEAQQKIAEQVPLPGGFRLEWAGEFGQLQEAIGRLAVAVPISIALICILLFLNFGSVIDMALAASVMPMALIGGIYALFLAGIPFSVSAAIGFVALFGIAAMDGIIVISSFNRLLESGMDRATALVRTCEIQMRPVVMTCMVACVGLAPAAVSTGIGSQVQKPLALVVVGGILLAPALILLVLPVLIDMFPRREPLTEDEPAPMEPRTAFSGERRRMLTSQPLTWRLTAASLLMLAGCEVGPDFERPAAPSADRYTASALPARTASTKVASTKVANTNVSGGEAQVFNPSRDIPAEWWRLFHSPALDALIKEAIKASPNLAAAEAALRQARELRKAGEGAFWPLVQASFNSSRNKTPATQSPVPANNSIYYNLYTAQPGVTYTPDVFGGSRRNVESLLAQEEAQRFQLEAAYLSLTSGLVGAALGEAGLRAQIAATQDIVRSQREALDILRKQLALGQIPGQDVAAQQALLAQAEASLPPLQKQLAQQRNLIAVLAGHVPSEQSPAAFELASLQLPKDLPLSLPSRLVEHRPDIRAAEETLHATSAQIGVAIANMLPQITLSATGGSSALSPLTIASLFGPGTSFWTIAAGATQTLFDGFALLHKKRAAEAAFDQAAAQYKEVVLTAFQNVADALEALKSDADALAATNAAEKAARESFDIARRQLALGAINHVVLLNAEITYRQAVISRVQAQAARSADTAALFQALGGGWWNRESASPRDVHRKILTADGVPR